MLFAILFTTAYRVPFERSFLRRSSLSFFCVFLKFFIPVSLAEGALGEQEQSSAQRTAAVTAVIAFWNIT